MTHTVEKIGGTSMSRLNELRDTLFIKNDEPEYGRIFVVSAFGGITNLLLEHKKTGAPGVYARFANADLLVNWVRLVKSDAEIALMREAAQIANRVMTTAIERLEPGVRECDAHRRREGKRQRQRHSILHRRCLGL